MATAAKLGHFGKLLIPKSVKLGSSSSLSYCNTGFRNNDQIRQLSAMPQPESNLSKTVTLIPGDGVGPEIASSVLSIFRQTGIPVHFEELFVSEVHPDRSVPVEKVVESMKRNNGIGLTGAIQVINTAAGELQSLTTKLRRALDLFANVVHIKSLEGVVMRHEHPLDFVIIREQTEGEYSALEHECVPGVVESLKLVTREKSLRIAKFAFDYATKRGRKSVTAVHKANIMKLGDGLFLRTCEEVSKLYPRIEFRNMIIDNCCMQLVSNPQQFDVMVMTNLYGNIVDNLGAGLVGGAGVVTGESYGADCVMFEPGARHTFQQAIGRDIANPTAMILSSAKMLRHMHMNNYADGLSKAVEAVLREGKVKTKDLGGYATTGDFTDAVIDKVRFD